MSEFENLYNNSRNKKLIDKIYNVLCDSKQVEKFYFDYITCFINSKNIKRNEIMFKNIVASYFNSLIELFDLEISPKLNVMLEKCRINLIVNLLNYLKIKENFSKYVFETPYIDSKQMLQLNIIFLKTS